MNEDGDTVDVEDDKCSDFIKPNSEEYCNVHNPCPGEGKTGVTFTNKKKMYTKSD